MKASACQNISDGNKKETAEKYLDDLIKGAVTLNEHGCYSDLITMLARATIAANRILELEK